MQSFTSSAYDMVQFLEKQIKHWSYLKLWFQNFLARGSSKWGKVYLWSPVTSNGLSLNINYKIVQSKSDVFFLDKFMWRLIRGLKKLQYPDFIKAVKIWGCKKISTVSCNRNTLLISFFFFFHFHFLFHLESPQIGPWRPIWVPNTHVGNHWLKGLQVSGVAHNSADF